MKVIEGALGHLFLIRFGEGRVTTATVFPPGTKVPAFGEGAALRSEEDEPDFRIGINLAVRRALKDEGLPKDQIRAIMREFYKKRPEWHPGRPKVQYQDDTGPGTKTKTTFWAHQACAAVKCACPCPTCAAARIARNWRG